VTALPAIQTRGTAVRLDLRVTPRASKNAIDGVRDGRLVVKVTAPPVDAAANDAVIALFSKVLDLPKRNVTIVLGATNRRKTVELAGTTEAAIRARLSAILS
jgi:uncharacterized protein (TIGR00251 family)